MESSTPLSRADYPNFETGGGGAVMVPTVVAVVAFLPHWGRQVTVARPGYIYLPALAR